MTVELYLQLSLGLACSKVLCAGNLSLGLNKECIIPSSAVKLIKVYTTMCEVMKESSWGRD